MTACRAAPSDDLPRAQLRTWAGLALAALDPAVSWDATFGDAVRATSALTFDALVRHALRDRDYEVRAHWALYVENYVEGFHVPFVYPGLAKEIALPSYRVETFAHSVLQVAHAKAGQPAAPVAQSERAATP